METGHTEHQSGDETHNKLRLHMAELIATREPAA
jgi:hypothetical protein